MQHAIKICLINTFLCLAACRTRNRLYGIKPAIGIRVPPDGPFFPLAEGYCEPKTHADKLVAANLGYCVT
jgi:hypothetical protein